MSTATKSQIQRTRVVADNLGNAEKTRISGIVKKWDAHGDKYFKYITKMNAVQDHYPEIFKLPLAKQEVASQRSESPPPTYFRSENTPAPFEKKEQATTAMFQSPLAKQEQEVAERSMSPAPSYTHVGNTPASFEKENPAKTTQRQSEDRRMLACTPDDNGGSYISASLAMVKKLPDDHCFLQFDIQHHQSHRFRVSHMDLTFSFRVGSSHSSLAIRGLAPKESIGARNEEAHSKKVGASIPVKAYGTGAEINAEYQVAKVVEHATVIRGSIRGQNESCAKWTVDENSSAMTGVPSHFCVALVVKYSGVFTLNLAIEAKQSGSWLKLWHDGPEIRITGSKEMNIDSLEGHYKAGWPLSRSPAEWNDWLGEITGDVSGGSVFHAQSHYIPSPCNR
ncbi:hypothetical protein CPC08DRAFT_711572 [Agrocybe pediades]|nr:hypothetical protein CPC08DRAFT_711572 [Agrocybe pediades]